MTGVTSVPLPAPEPGHHWEEGDPGDRDVYFVVSYTRGNGETVTYYYQVPDGPLWPTVPGAHRMVRLSDGQTITALLDDNRHWHWLGTGGAKCRTGGGGRQAIEPAQYLRPADPAPKAGPS